MIWFRVLAGFAIVWFALFLGVHIVDHLDQATGALQFATYITGLIGLLMATVFCLIIVWEER